MKLFKKHINKRAYTKKHTYIHIYIKYTAHLIHTYIHKMYGMLICINVYIRYTAYLYIHIHACIRAYINAYKTHAHTQTYS